MATPRARLVPWIHLVLLAALASSAGCAWTSYDRYAQGELACGDAQACDAMWGAAQSWILANSGLELAERSDSLLETDCSRHAAFSACYTVMRLPGGSGDTQIRIYIACGNDVVPCEQPATQLRNELTAAMRSAVPGADATHAP
jgi:hypothetical protein